MNRTAALLAVTVAAVGVAAPSALAAPKKKPISKSYSINVPTPDPSNFAQQGYSVCAQNVPQSFHIEEFKVPAAGTLQVDMSGFVGDHDLLLMDNGKEELAFSGNTEIPNETVSVKFKKPTTVYIVGCNWAGGPTANMKYVFSFK